MDDRKIAQHANFDVMGFEILDRHRHRRLLEKAGAVNQRLVGIGTIEVLGKVRRTASRRNSAPRRRSRD
jgi:hypothetical protein